MVPQNFPEKFNRQRLYTGNNEKTKFTASPVRTKKFEANMALVAVQREKKVDRLSHDSDSFAMHSLYAPPCTCSC